MQAKVILRRTFTNETIVVDGHHFVDCTFVNVRFIFNGNQYKFENPTFENCNWILAGEALETAKFLMFVAFTDPSVPALPILSGKVADRKVA